MNLLDTGRPCADILAFPPWAWGSLLLLTTSNDFVGGVSDKQKGIVTFTGRSFKSQYSFQLYNWLGEGDTEGLELSPALPGAHSKLSGLAVSPAAKLRRCQLIHIYMRFSSEPRVW